MRMLGNADEDGWDTLHWITAQPCDAMLGLGARRDFQREENIVIRAPHLRRR